MKKAVVIIALLALAAPLAWAATRGVAIEYCGRDT